MSYAGQPLKRLEDPRLVAGKGSFVDDMHLPNMLYASVLRTWVDDEDPGQARTMAALDRELARGARCGALLDDVWGIASVLGRLRPGRRWRRRDREEPRGGPGEEPAAV